MLLLNLNDDPCHYSVLRRKGTLRVYEKNMATQFDNTEIAFKYQANKDLKQARILFSFIASPILTGLGIAMTKISLALHLPVKSLIRKTIFRQFCGGETLAETAETSNVLGKYSVDTILDYGAERKQREQDFDTAVAEFIKAIQFAASQQHTPFISLKISGIAKFSLLEKIHACVPLAEAEIAEWQKVYQRLDEVCCVAAENNIMLLVDAEETWIQDPCNELTEAMMEKYNREKVIVFNTYQLYCNGTLSFLRASIEKAVVKGYLLGAKLVRGAYMEKERERAKRLAYPDPIQADKNSTNSDFNVAILYCLNNLDKLALFIGTHNERSCIKATKYMKALNIAPSHEHVFFSQLYGMSDNISFNLAINGYNVSKYLPYGPVKDVIPYLMRRAEENTSVAGQTSRELELINKEIRRRKSLVL